MQLSRARLTFFILTLCFLGFAHPASALTYVGGTIPSDITWEKSLSPYIVSTPIGIPAGVTLTIEPGVVVKMGQPSCNCYSNITINGTLIAGSDSATERVVFTSEHDDIGGDTDGTSTPPTAGDWRMIAMNAGARFELHHADVKYGGLATAPHIFFNPDAVRMLLNQGGTVIMDDAEISFAYAAASYSTFFDGTSTIISSRFHDSPTNIEQYLGSVTIQNSVFASSSVGITLSGAGTLSIASSSFMTSYGVVNNSASTVVSAQNNYWNSTSGPTHPLNPSGTGAIITGNVLYDPWLDKVPGTCVADCYSNVMFLPGIMGSRLFEQSSDCGVFNNEKERWVSMFDCDHEHLSLYVNGKSVYPLYTKEGEQGVIDDTYGFNIYQSFLADLADWKSEGTINDYALLPYDWRISLEDILMNGASSTDKLSYGTSQGFQNGYIYKKLKELTESSKTGKVTIIAHSNGGLVTKALIQKLKETNDPLYDRIDKVIFVAVPQSGTPETIGSILHGADIGPGGVVISAKRVRDLLHNMPFAYNLLPTDKYVGTGTPLVEFSGFSATSSFAKYGASIDTMTNLNDYLGGGDGRASPDYSDLLHAQIANSSLLSDAQNVHAVLDNWTPATSTEVYEIAGWGVPTITGLKYEPNKICNPNVSTPHHQGAPQKMYCTSYVDSFKISDKISIDGDGTVMKKSAHQIASSTTVHQYWLDLAKFNDDNFVTRNHKDIFEVSYLSNFLKTILLELPKTNLYLVDSSMALSSIKSTIKYEIHSPLSLSIYDSEGHHTGISTTTGLIELGVKGSLYHEIGDSKFVIVDESIPHTMFLDAYDSGSFTLDIERQSSDEVTSSTTFMGIPTSTSTKATVAWNANGEIDASTLLAIDFDGDNTIDTELSGEVGSVVYIPIPEIDIDTTPPSTTAVVGGTLGTNAWYTSNALVSLAATDTESGVATTLYSLNSGATWTPFSFPISFTTEGTTAILYYSIDKAGNREAANTLTLKIDKTAPEAQITFDPMTQKLKISGSDNLGSTTVVTNATSSLISDNAGHTLKVLLTNLRQNAKSGRINMAVNALVYDGVTTPLASTTFKYKWATTTPAITYKMFAAYFTASSTSTEAHCRPKKSATIIMSTPADLDDLDVDDVVDTRATRVKLTGMMVPYLQSVKGKVIVSY